MKLGNLHPLAKIRSVTYILIRLTTAKVSREDRRQKTIRHFAPLVHIWKTWPWLTPNKNVQNAQKRMKIAATEMIGRAQEEDEVKITHPKDVILFLKQFQKCFQKWSTFGRLFVENIYAMYIENNTMKLTFARWESDYSNMLLSFSTIQ